MVVSVDIAVVVVLIVVVGGGGGVVVVVIVKVVVVVVLVVVVVVPVVAVVAVVVLFLVLVLVVVVKDAPGSHQVPFDIIMHVWMDGWILAARPSQVPFDIVDLAADRVGRGGASVDRVALLGRLKSERLPRVQLGEDGCPDLDACLDASRLQDLEDFGELDALLRPLLYRFGL